MTEVETDRPPVVAVEHAADPDVAAAEDALRVPSRPVRRAPGRGRLRLGTEIGAVAVAPIALFFLLRVEPYFRQNGIDPFIYLGYAFDHKNLTDRYGPTYYGVRFSLILPINFTTDLFGTVGGYFVLRYALALLAGGAVYLLFRRTHGRGTAALGAVLMLTSPMFLRALMTSYSDTTGVPYLTGALALLIWSSLSPPTRARPLQIFGAGLLLGLALHSNPFNAAMGFFLVAALCVAEATRRRWRLAIDLATIAAAVVIVTAIGVLYYAWRFGTPNIIRPSIDAANTYSGESGDLFKAPEYDWILYRYHLYLPPLALACWLALRARGMRSVTRGEAIAVTSLGATFVFFLYYEFVRGGTALENYYYTSYLTGPLVVTMTYTIAAALERRRDRERVAAACAAVVVGLPVVRNLAWGGFEFTFWPTVPILLALCVGAMAGAGARRGPARSAVPVLASMILLTVTTALLLGAPRNPALSEGQTFRYDPHYEAAFGNDDRTGLDWYKLTHDLVRQTPDLATPEGHVLFWFPGDNGLINSIQSAYLWRQSTLMSTGPGLPFLDDWRLARLQEQRARWLVALGGSRSEVEGGVEALRSRGVVLVAADDFVLRAGDSVVFGTTITLQPPPG